MKQAVLSIYVYSIYLFGLGGTLMLAPNIPLPIFGLPETHEVWIRIVGFTVIVLAIFYFMAARNRARQTMAISVAIRVSVPFVFGAFVVAGFAPWNLILFTPADVLFALWTWYALRKSPAEA